MAATELRFWIIFDRARERADWRSPSAMPTSHIAKKTPPAFADF